MNAKQRKLKAAKRKHHNNPRRFANTNGIKIGSRVKVTAIHVCMPRGSQHNDIAEVVFVDGNDLVIGHPEWCGHRASACETYQQNQFKNHPLCIGENLWHINARNVKLVK